MKKLLHFLLSAMLFTSCQTAKKTVFNQMVNTENTYLYAIDLVNVEKDKVFVTRLTPKSNLEKGRFVIPKLVPGYSLPLMPNLTEKQLALRRYWINE